MFDWQAERAPLVISTTATAGLHSDMTTSSPAIVVASAPDQTIGFAPLRAPALATIQKPSFAQALRGSPVQFDPLPMPTIRGERLSVKIIDTVYYRLENQSSWSVSFEQSG